MRGDVSCWKTDFSAWSKFNFWTFFSVNVKVIAEDLMTTLTKLNAYISHMG